MSDEVVAELSANYRNLTDEERAYYEELGELAASRRATGARAFGPRIRQLRVSATGVGVVVSAANVADCVAEAHDDSVEEGALVAVPDPVGDSF